MNEPAHLLVTGCYRSGTTLVEKLLHGHPRVILASQPFPVLYISVKEAFLEELGVSRRYPLDHLFGEDAYTPKQWCRFLDEYRLDEERLEVFFKRLEAYTEGLWTPEMVRFRAEIEPGTFWQVYCQLNRCAARLFPKPDPLYAGGKEVLCEEYVAYLLGRGVRVVIVLRDPRAMICSLNFRRRDNLTGENRPVLYSLRAWRKSVAVALAFENHPGLLRLRYEDLVTHPDRELSSLTDFLGLLPYPTGAFAAGIRDQHGALWAGNSSFADNRGISPSSLRAYEDRLPGEVRRFIETICFPEMVTLGYATRPPDEAALRGYRDPFEQIHAKFPRDYSSDPQRIAREVARLDMLTRPRPPEAGERRRWFLDERAYMRLREAMNPSNRTVKPQRML